MTESVKVNGNVPTHNYTDGIDIIDTPAENSKDAPVANIPPADCNCNTGGHPREPNGAPDHFKYVFAERNSSTPTSGAYHQRMVSNDKTRESREDNRDTVSSVYSMDIETERRNYLYDKNEFLDIEDDEDQIDEYFDESPQERVMNDSHHIHDKSIIELILEQTPDQECKILVRKLVEKHSEVFKDDLTDAAALLEPFKLEMIEKSDWATLPANKRSARLMTTAKQYELNKFLEKAIANNMIRPSQASAWSQILMTPKPNGSWRFCVDFRNLNNMTKSMGWPIPNINQMIQRIGQQKATWYAVLDLTSGYYQAPISEESKPYTAFRTASGLWEWNRLPMGLKGAPSYFQHHMQLTVLKDLQYKTCEVYLDDIIVFGNTREELMSRLDTILHRLKTFNITLNPSKVKIGLQQVEYLGHVIDRHGLSFSKEKKIKYLILESLARLRK